MGKYHFNTGTVEGKDIFDVTTTGSSDYDSLIPGNPENEYMRKRKNLKGEIKMISPLEYFQGCAKIFNSSVEKLKKQTEYVGNAYKTIGELADVITKDKSQYPLTYLNFANPTQEGMHRMYVAGELFGWDTKFPCLIVNWADDNLHKKQLKDHHIYQLQDELEKIIKEVKYYKYYDLEEVYDELEYELEHCITNWNEYNDIKISYNIDVDLDKYVASLLSYWNDGSEIKVSADLWFNDITFKDKEEVSDDLPDDILLDDEKY